MIRSYRLAVRYPQRRADGGIDGRDPGMARHHFDIGVVSVFVKFVIRLRISCRLEQSYASPAIRRIVSGFIPRGSTARAPVMRVRA